MKDLEYLVKINEKLTPIPTIDNICLILQKKFDMLAEKIDYLQEENKKLKDQNWKDKELQKMKLKMTTAIEDARRGFPISEEELKAVNSWIEKHEKEKHFNPNRIYPRGGAIGGSYSYIFTPTSIGVFGTVKCSCGESFDFQQEA